MSSVVIDRPITTSDTDWVQVREAAPADPIATLRAQIFSAARKPQGRIIHDMGEYGSGDAALADDIAADMAARWDD